MILRWVAVSFASTPPSEMIGMDERVLYDLAMQLLSRLIVDGMGTNELFHQDSCVFTPVKLFAEFIKY